MCSNKVSFKEVKVRTGPIDGYKDIYADNNIATMRETFHNTKVRFEKLAHQSSNAALMSEHGSQHSSDRHPILTVAMRDADKIEKKHRLDTDEPKRRSWGSLRPDEYTANSFRDKDVSPTTVPRPSNTGFQAMVSPVNSSGSWSCNSPVSVIGHSDVNRIEKPRKDSKATVWPRHSPTIKIKEPIARQTHTTQDTCNFADTYREAKGIYKVGPRGEGQKLWSSYKKARAAKRDLTEIREILPMEMIPKSSQKNRRPSPEVHHAPIESMLRTTQQTRRPPAGLTAHSPLRTTSVPIDEIPRQTKQVGLSSPPRYDDRKDSEVSFTSREVPCIIHTDVRQYVDTAKSLPQVPYLQPAPRSRPQGSSKKLPSVPRLQNTPASITDSRAIVTPSKPWKAFHNAWSTLSNAVKSSDSKLPTLTHFVAQNDKPNAIQNKISRPQPIFDIQDGHTANIPIEMGGIGGPSTLRPLPVAMSERQKGKQKAQPDFKDLAFRKQWREIMPTPAVVSKQRQDSDASFQCVGVDLPSKYAPMKEPMPSNSFLREERVTKRNAVRFPSPLYSGTGDLKAAGGIKDRDTKFYQPYVEILDEYDEDEK